MMSEYDEQDKQSALTNTQFFDFMHAFEKRVGGPLHEILDSMEKRFDNIDNKQAAIDYRLDLLDNRLDNELMDIKRTQQTILNKLDTLIDE